MRHSVLLVTTLFAIVLMSDVPVAMTANFDAQLSARMGLLSRRQPERPVPFSLFPDPPAGESGEGAEDFL
jgi:hypothetical protein